MRYIQTHDAAVPWYEPTAEINPLMPLRDRATNRQHGFRKRCAAKHDGRNLHHN
jgi:hypothetical protein